MENEMRKDPLGNILINEAVLESWNAAWGDRLPNGTFKASQVAWKFIHGSYHVFIDKQVAYQTTSNGNPEWIEIEEYNKLDFASFGGLMPAPDMELDEIHAAQALVNGGG